MRITTSSQTSWFGSQGAVYLNQDLRDLAVETMQLMIEFHEPIPQKDL